MSDSTSVDQANTKPRKTTVGLALASVAALGCCFLINAPMESARAQQANPAAPTKIKVGAIESLQWMTFYVSLSRGIFAKHGLDIELTNMNNPIPALIAGELQFTMNGADVAVIAAARGKPTPAVAMMQQTNLLSIHGRADVPWPNASKGYPAKMEDLRGKAIGMGNLGTSGEIFVRLAMLDAKMEVGRDYSIVVIGGGAANLVTALKAHTVDAVLLYPPWSQLADSQKISVPIARQANNEGPESSLKSAGLSINVNGDFLRNNKETVKKFTSALVEGSTFLRNYEKNKTELLEIASKYSGVTDKLVLERILPDVSARAEPSMNCDAWALTVKGLKTLGTISNDPKCEEIAALDVAPARGN
jgi:NitT/TauT family transport system substrate-binding protein